MKGEDGGAGIQNKLQRISRANSIGGDSSIYGGVSELDTNKFLRDQIFLVVGWMWILLIAGLINALMKLLQLLPSFRLGQLKAVAPNLDLRVARKMVKEMSYGDMLALLETAYHVGDTEAMDKVCIEAFERVIDGWED